MLRLPLVVCLIGSQLLLAACQAVSTTPPMAAPSEAPNPPAPLERLSPSVEEPSFADAAGPTGLGNLALQVGFGCGGAGFSGDADFTVTLAKDGADPEAYPVVLPADGTLTLNNLEPGTYHVSMATQGADGQPASTALGDYTVSADQSRSEAVPCERLSALSAALVPAAPAGTGTAPSFGGGGSGGGAAGSFLGGGTPSVPAAATGRPRGHTGQPVRVIDRQPVVTTPSYLGVRYRQKGGAGLGPAQIAPLATLDDQSTLPLDEPTLAATQQGRYYAMADYDDDGYYRLLGRVRFSYTRNDPNNKGNMTLVANMGGRLRRFFCNAEGHLVAIGYGMGASTQFMIVDPEEVRGQRFTGAAYPEGTDARLFYYLDDRHLISELYLGKQPDQQGVLGMSFPDPKYGYVHLQRLSR